VGSKEKAPANDEEPEEMTVEGPSQDTPTPGDDGGQEDKEVTGVTVSEETAEEAANMETN